MFKTTGLTYTLRDLNLAYKSLAAAEAVFFFASDASFKLAGLSREQVQANDAKSHAAYLEVNLARDLVRRLWVQRERERLGETFVARVVDSVSREIQS